jgi:hypothetical protein
MARDCALHLRAMPKVVPTRGAALLGQELLVNDLFKNRYFTDQWNYDWVACPR